MKKNKAERGKNYYLFIILKKGKGKPLRVHKNPITIKMMDELTTKYESEIELINTILDNTGSIVNKRDISRLQIRYYPNKRNMSDDGYKLTPGPLYRKDMAVFDQQAILEKFELLVHDRNFVKEFIKGYKDSRNLRGYVSEIEGCLEAYEDYSEPLSLLIGKVFEKNESGEVNYKSIRNTYLCIKKYERERDKDSINESSKVGQVVSRKSANQIDGQTTFIMTGYVKPNKSKQGELKTFNQNMPPISENEKREMTLAYLMKHERELLDIDDFYGREEESPFDAHKSK